MGCLLRSKNKEYGMKKLIAIFGLVTLGVLSAIGQDWSEYSRGSDAWHKHNRDALFHPWKYDRGGRLKRGKHVAVRGKARRHHKH